jgi:hypothetical protein
MLGQCSLVVLVRTVGIRVGVLNRLYHILSCLEQSGGEVSGTSLVLSSSGVRVCWLGEFQVREDRTLPRRAVWS